MSQQLATLFADYTQSTRFLRLTTALGSEKLLAECVRGEETISAGYRFTISALSQDAGISLRTLLGQPALLELLTIKQGERRAFHGYLTAVELNGSNGGLARYTLTLQPWSAFLARGRDSRVFLDKTVFDILDAVFGAYGSLVPSWRFELANRDIYPIRSLTTQYQESDLAFAERLMYEEGLFYYFEHAGDTHAPGLGSHQMVIADHNGAFKPNTQPYVRYTKPGAVMKEDSIDRWRNELRLQPTAIELTSWDYRSRDCRQVSSGGANSTGISLVSRDAPGAYAYASRSHGQRIADRQMEALEARREIFIGAGTVRTLAPGTTFTLSGHAVHDMVRGDDGRTFAVTRVLHLMHNNFTVELQAKVEERVGPAAVAAAIATDQASSLHAVGRLPGERPLYRNCINAIQASTVYRASGSDEQGHLLHPRPTIQGQQTAVVVGPAGAVIHTDRDHRVKIQFHWQRGANSHSRLSHPAPDGHAGAPADDSAGTWVRVATPLAPVAGANWGSNALPRIGQEVLVDFMDGDIDRPVIIGALYNGRGQADAQHNGVSHGAGAASGNAPAWFAGETGAHAHPAVLSGLKSQAMSASQDGSGAYSQLLFDDSPGQARVALQRHASAHKGTDELNLGHLRHQVDNQRLKPVGFGAELKSEHSVALRAGQGMLLSTDQRSGGSGSQLDSREAQAQIRASQQLQESLAATAQKHNAALKRPDGKAAGAPESLAAISQMKHSVLVVESGGSGDSAVDSAGKVTAFSEPHLQLSSPLGIVAVTPADCVLTAGNTTSFSSGQDINFASQGDYFQAVAAGISLFTYGKASNAGKPNQETGIKLHAASGKVSTASQSGDTRVTADKTVTVASVTKTISVAAKTHVLMTAQGAYLKIEGGNIMLHGPGKVEFKASMKELAGPINVPSAEIAAKIHELNIKRDLEIEYVDADGNPLTDEPIVLSFNGANGQAVALDGSGKAKLKHVPLGPFRAEQPKRK